MALGIFDERTVLVQQILMVPADGVATKVIVAANSSDRRIDALMVANRDGIAHVVNVTMVFGGITVQLGSVSIPAGQGYAGTPSLDLLVQVLPATQVGINLPPTATLNVVLSVAIVATFDVSFCAIGGVF